jgi:hypothetical protein
MFPGNNRSRGFAKQLYNLGVEPAQARLPVVVENEDCVDHFNFCQSIISLLGRSEEE